MKDILIVTDMQNDFIHGVLGTKEAVAIVDAVVKKVKDFQGEIFFLMDTHDEHYMDTQEGTYLPVPHCLEGRSGWELAEPLKVLVEEKGHEVIRKSSFGSIFLAQDLMEKNKREEIATITLVGLCTDICVIANAMILKAALPQARIVVDAKACAGVTPESHRNALSAMEACQIFIEE